MKKLTLIMSLMVCLLCFVGCNNNEVVVNGEENNQQQEEQNPNVEQPSVGDGDLDIPSEEPKVEEPKVEEPKVEEPKVEEPKVEEPKVEEPKVEEPKVEEPKPEEPVADKTVDLFETMTNIVTKAEAEVRMPMQEAIPAEVSFSFMGITLEDFNTYVEESIVYESMISPANQSICLIKVNDSSKVADLKKAIYENSNLRKWVCMSAERGVVIESGNYILLAMAESAKCDDIVKAFSEEFDGNVGEVLSKIAE